MSNTPHVPMDDAHLKNYAANAARGSKAEGTVSGRVLSRALKRDLDRIRRAREALKAGVTPDALLTDVEEALSALGELTGQSVRKDVTDRIFARFCVGK